MLVSEVEIRKQILTQPCGLLLKITYPWTRRANTLRKIVSPAFVSGLKPWEVFVWLNFVIWQPFFQVRMKQSARSNCLVIQMNRVGNSVNSLIWSLKLEGSSWDVSWGQKISFRLAISLSWKGHHGVFILLDSCFPKYYHGKTCVRIPWGST